MGNVIVLEFFVAVELEAIVGMISTAWACALAGCVQKIFK